MDCKLQEWRGSLYVVKVITLNAALCLWPMIAPKDSFNQIKSFESSYPILISLLLSYCIVIQKNDLVLQCHQSLG